MSEKGTANSATTIIIWILSIVEKIFACILLNRLNSHLEQGLLPESQCGFYCRCSTTDMILIFSAMLMDACCDERPGIRVAYTTDGHLLNQRRMHFQSRVSTTTVHGLLFANDYTLNVTTEGYMRRIMDLFAAA
nr:unnamed protein product [Spirometra erinaceieuropaei]